MINDIIKWVGSCKKCNQHKRYQPHIHGLLEPIKSEFPFCIVGMDIAVHFEKSTGGNKYILVIIDYFTNWLEVILLKSLIAEDTTRAFIKDIMSRHGCTQKVITDHGTNFKSINSLGTVINSSMKNSDEMLDNVQFLNRISFTYTEFNDSPFFLFYERDAVLPQDLAILPSKSPVEKNKEETVEELKI